MGIIPEKKCFKEPSQLLKFLILFICGVFTCNQVAQCVKKFVYPPASTYSEYILNDSVRYPCLTICRRPAYKTKLFELFGVPSTSSIDGAFTFRSFNFERYSLSDFWEMTTYNFSEIVGQYAYASTGNAVKLRSGPNLKISSSMHIKRGRCYTFQPLIPSNIFSINGGYVFYLFHNTTNQQLNEFGVSTHGFQIYLHDPNEAVTYDDDERNNFLEYLDLEAAEDMRVKFQIQEFGRLPTKDNHCKADGNYSKSQCEEHCFNQQIAKQNNCTAPFLKLPDGVEFPECRTFGSIRNLIRDYTSRRDSWIQNCNCPMACNFTVYKTSIINRRGVEPALGGNSMICLFCTNLLFRMSEVLGYDWSQLLSDIGGSLGFLLGLSVISLICLCEEIFQIIFRWMFKRRMQRALEDSKPNNSELDTKENYEEDDVTVMKQEKLENQHETEKSPEYTNLNELVIDYNYYKKDSEFTDRNCNNNLKY